MIVIKTRTLRPLANKRSTPVAASSINLPAARPPSTARHVHFSSNRMYSAGENAPRILERTRVVSHCGRGISLSASGAPPPSGTPREEEKKKERRPQGSSRRLFTGVRDGNKNIDGSVPARGRDNRLIIHRPHDHAGYSAH
jgi:hypothetical protein